MERQEIISQVCANIGFFRNRWGDFCGRMEDFATKLYALSQEHKEEADAALKARQKYCQTPKDTHARWVARVEVDDTYEQWVACFREDYVPVDSADLLYIKGPMGPLLAKPVDLVNPATWFFGPSIPLDNEEQILRDAVLLAVVHTDYFEGKGAEARVYQRGSYPRESRFLADAFVNALSQRLEAIVIGNAWGRMKAHLPQSEVDDQTLAGNATQDKDQPYGNTENREKTWSDIAPGFILISTAREKYCDGSMAPTLAVLGRGHCKPDGEFDYMRSGNRRKVHEEQFAAYADKKGWTKAAEAKAKAFVKACEKPRTTQAKLRKKWDMKPEDYDQ